MSNLDSNPFADPEGSNPFAVRENKRALGGDAGLEQWVEGAWTDCRGGRGGGRGLGWAGVLRGGREGPGLCFGNWRLLLPGYQLSQLLNVDYLTCRLRIVDTVFIVSLILITIILSVSACIFLYESTNK